MIKRLIAVLIAAAFLAACSPSPAAEENVGDTYRGAVISVLGDSISTFSGWVPTADGVNLEHTCTYPRADLLSDVNLTWWKRVIDGLGARLGVNDSWRGSMVSGAVPSLTGDAGERSAFYDLTRIRNLGANGTPDVILVYGGTNDYGNLGDLGSFDPSLMPGTADLTLTAPSSLAEAYAWTILRIRYYYPDAKIAAILPAPTASYYDGERLEEGNAILAAVCDRYGVPYVDLNKCGVTVGDLPDGIHPNENGMEKIADAVLAMLCGN